MVYENKGVCCGSAFKVGMYIALFFLVFWL